MLAWLSVCSEVQTCVRPSATGISSAGACRDVDTWCMCGVCCWVPSAVGGSAPPAATAAAEALESRWIIPLPGRATADGLVEVSMSGCGVNICPSTWVSIWNRPARPLGSDSPAASTSGLTIVLSKVRSGSTSSGSTSLGLRVLE